ncbi:MAG TPA: LacI family DNA-binding transcriptional regulator [Ideonella sp.]|uniref:LacI family DNA-binding transcriptional regulator n=1 Tax=Ideonella sp. TaxID=1929293 RepID=UPI002CC8B6B4|nr:LacI family DNA-binding transcriptional regulator [Ideonella sp.]HSI48512.1 LacI family DNA-binding transcriptional regulator [Ideonella sp.]
MPAKAARAGAPRPETPAKRVTMTDVATQAGVSQSTVSLVLNGMTGTQLAEETRARVARVAVELGYQLPERKPERRAAAAKRVPANAGAGTGLILYLVDEVSTSPHAALSIDGAKDEAWRQGALVCVFATRSSSAVEAAVLATMLANPQLLGVVYSTIFTRAVTLPAPLAGVPTVLLNCHPADEGAAPVALSISSVEPSEVTGGQVATECLIDAGHRRIGFVNGEPWMDAAHDRLLGYRRALASADIAFDRKLVREGDWHVASGHECTLLLMRQEPPPTAIFCANDLMAVGCLEALHELGLRVPQDISVMGYDDQEIARHTRPALSTLVLPDYEMGRLAVEVLLAEVAEPARRKRRHKVEGSLVPRATVAPPKPR